MDRATEYHDLKVDQILEQIVIFTQYVERSAHPDIWIKRRSGLYVAGWEMLTRTELNQHSPSVCIDETKIQTLDAHPHRDAIWIVTDRGRIDTWAFVKDQLRVQPWQTREGLRYKYIDDQRHELSERFGREPLRHDYLELLNGWKNGGYLD